MAREGHAFSLAFAHCGEGIGSFAALGDGEHHRFICQRRVAVSQFAGVLDFHRDAGKLLDEVLTDECGVPACAAGGEHDPVNVSELLGGEVESAEPGGRLVFIESAPHRVFDGLRLLEDLLEHVVFEITLVDVGGDLIQRLH